jgi:hypothetical protein
MYDLYLFIDVIFLYIVSGYVESFNFRAIECPGLNHMYPASLEGPIRSLVIPDI